MSYVLSISLSKGNTELFMHELSPFEQARSNLTKKWFISWKQIWNQLITFLSDYAAFQLNSGFSFASYNKSWLHWFPGVEQELKDKFNHKWKFSDSSPHFSLALLMESHVKVKFCRPQNISGASHSAAAFYERTEVARVLNVKIKKGRKKGKEN